VGNILRSSGEGNWSAQVIGNNSLNGVWGSGQGDVYIVGDAGVILHSAGDGNWSALSSGTTENLTGVWGSGNGDVYAVGSNGTILHLP
jgi:hypothetical protein